jgi:hypothetical protein
VYCNKRRNFITEVRTLKLMQRKRYYTSPNNNCV